MLGDERLRVLSFDLNYASDIPSKEGDTWNYFARALETARAIPGVRDVAITSQLPMSGDFDSWGIHQERAPRPSPADDPGAFRFAVNPNYLQLMGIPLKRGRGFTPQDDRRATPVVIVNETMARLDFAGRDPVGECVKMGGMDGVWRTIVGVAGDVHPLTAPVRDALHTLDRRVPVTNFLTLSELLHRSTEQRRFALFVFQLFAEIAVLLAAVGIYGVMSRSVTERQREIGIRTALGAPRERILGLVLRQGGMLVLGGGGLRVAGALALARVLRALLFQVAPNDPTTLAIISLMLAAVAMLAVVIPAWRATRVDAMEALRAE